jgi:ribose transport system permease protein
MTAIEHPVPDPVRKRPPRPTSGHVVFDVLTRFGAVWALVALSIFYSIVLPDTFAQFATVQTILSTQAVVGMVALASLFVLVSGEFDLSVGAIAGLSALLTAKLNGGSDWAAFPALMAGLGLGAAIGLLNGIAVTLFRIDSFIATLASATIISGAATAMSQGLTVSTNPTSQLTTWGQRFVFGGQIPIAAIYLFGLAFVVWFIIDVSAWGRGLRAVGANVQSALLIGLPVRRVKLTAFVASGLTSGAAGVVSVMVVGAASPSAGPAYLLPAYAAAFVGSTTIFPGRFNVPGTLVAIFLLAVGVTGIQLWGAASWAEQVFNGCALLIAVGLAVRNRRLRAA